MAQSNETNTPVWKSSRGPIAVTEMATAHIKNAIATVEGEISKGVTQGEAILVHLKNELSGRSDA